VIVTFSTMHYGMKEKNPLDFVKFYSKNRPNQCYHAKRGDLSLLMPHQFAEVLLRVFTKDVRFFGIVQAGYRELLTRVTKMPEPTSIDIQGSDSDGPIERPRTPRTFSRVSSFNKSFNAESGENGESGSPFFNQFTTVSKGYGKSLVHSTSPTKIRTPQPVSMLSPTLGSDESKLEEHRMEIYPLIQAPSSPTTTKPETRSRAPITSTSSEDTSARGMAGVDIDSPAVGDNDAGVSLLSANPEPSGESGMRSSKRVRKDREEGSKTNEQSRSSGTSAKRKKV